MKKPSALYLSANALFVDDTLKTKTAPDNIEYLRADLVFEFAQWMNNTNAWFWSPRNKCWLWCQPLQREQKNQTFSTAQLYEEFLKLEHPEILITPKTE